MENEVFDMIFNVLGSIVTVMKSITFLGVSVFHWSIGFLIMSAVITYLLNTANSPYVESYTSEVRRKEIAEWRAARRNRRGG